MKKRSYRFVPLIVLLVAFGSTLDGAVAANRQRNGTTSPSFRNDFESPRRRGSVNEDSSHGRENLAQKMAREALESAEVRDAVRRLSSANYQNERRGTTMTKHERKHGERNQREKTLDDGRKKRGWKRRHRKKVSSSNSRRGGSTRRADDRNAEMVDREPFVENWKRAPREESMIARLMKTTTRDPTKNSTGDQGVEYAEYYNDNEAENEVCDNEVEPSVRTVREVTSRNRSSTLLSNSSRGKFVTGDKHAVGTRIKEIQRSNGAGRGTVKLSSSVSHTDAKAKLYSKPGVDTKTKNDPRMTKDGASRQKSTTDVKTFIDSDKGKRGKEVTVGGAVQRESSPKTIKKSATTPKSTTSTRSESINSTIFGSETKVVASEILNEIVEELEELKLDNPKSGQEEGLPCKLTGSWVTTRAGVLIDMKVLRRKIRVVLAKLVPPVTTEGLLNVAWNVTGFAPFKRGGSFTLIATNNHTKTLAVFVGACKVCQGIDTIEGSWTVSREPRDCRDFQLSINIFNEIFRRTRLYTAVRDKQRESNSTTGSNDTSTTLTGNSSSTEVNTVTTK